MKTTSKYSVLQSPIDIGLKTMLQHQSYVLLNEIINFSIKAIELAVQCDDPRLERIAKDAYYIYSDARQLINYFTLAGIDAIPDETWADPEGMRKHFNVSYAEMLSRLNKQTKEKLTNKGIQL